MASSSRTVQRCHYEVMGVDRKIDASELPRIYRRLALQLHPDKTGDNGDAFKELRAAYEVLSNPVERQWYDDHREAILRGNTASGDDDTADAHSPGPNLWPYFSTSCYGPGTPGFYAVYEAVFAELFDDEKEWGAKGAAAKQPPTFGDAASPRHVVNTFYDYWSNFVSSKSFGWADKYNLADAPSREVRRMMDRENAKLRNKHRKEFHEQIRSLLAFMKRRDPRVIKNTQAKPQKTAGESAPRQTKQAAPTAAELAAIAALRQEHYESSVEDLRSYLAQLEEDFGAEEDDDEAAAADEQYCIACRRGFKSQAQWANHERGKKHQQAVAKLRKQVLLDGEDDEPQAQAQASSAVDAPEQVDSQDADVGQVGVNADDAVDEEEQLQVAAMLAEERRLKRLKMKQRKRRAKQRYLVDSSDSDDNDDDDDDDDDSEPTSNADSATPLHSEPAAEDETVPPTPVDSDSDSGPKPRTKAARRKLARAKAKAASQSCEQPTAADSLSPPPPPPPPPEEPEETATGGKKPRRRAAKAQRGKSAAASSDQTYVIVGAGATDTEHQCRICKAAFTTKNKLHQHLKKNPSHAREPK